MDYDHMMRGESARAIDRTREILAERAMIDMANMMRNNQVSTTGYVPRGWRHVTRAVFTWLGAFLIVVTVFGILNYLIMH
jgi:hypothetical protein